MGSARSRRSPRNARRSPGLDWDKTPPPPPRIRSPGGRSRSPKPLTERQWRKKYGSAPDFIPEPEERQDSPVSDKSLVDSLPDYDSDGSIYSNIVVASSRRTIDHAAEVALRQLLDHQNIALYGSRWFTIEHIPEDAPLLSLPDPGSLHALIHACKGRDGELPTRERKFALPEMLCWHVLRSLLRAVNFLHTGNKDVQNNHIDPFWQPIVHNYINPSNIQFDHEHTERRTFKDCRLKNFRRCVILPRPYDPDGPDNVGTADDRRAAFAAVGNRNEETGFEAPEFWDTALDHAPSPQSDLWSIGAVLVAMMTARTVWDLVNEKEFIDGSARRRKQADILPERFQKVTFNSRLRAFRRIPTGELAKMLPDRYGEHLPIMIEPLLSYDPLDRGTAMIAARKVEVCYRARRKYLDTGEEIFRWPSNFT